MTLYTIVNILKQIALTQPNVNSATDGSIYDIMNATNSVKYDVVHFSQTKHISDEERDTYRFNIFYVSRLEDSLEDNRLQIQSIGKEVLDNILRTFCENWGVDYPEIIFYPFTQKFADLCAGCYCKVDIEVPKEIICADDYTAEVVPGTGIKLQNVTVNINQNGLRVITPAAEYDGIGEVTIVTDVPQTAAVLQYKEVEYTENGDYTVTPDAGYDGLSDVAISINVASGGGYDEGYEDGVADQKAKLTVTSFTQNDTYTRADGWSAVTVNVPSDYQDGYDDGVADQKAKLSTTSVTENGTYTREDGYSAITVDVPQGQGYEEGYEDGVADQKAKLITTAVTENGTYAREDGYSAFSVNVDDRYDEGYGDGEAAQKAKLTVTSFTQNDTYTRTDGWSSVTVNVDDRYDEGYADGYVDGVAYQKSLLSSTSFTENGVYTRENGWNEVSVDVESGNHRVVFDFSESEDLSGLTGNAVVTITSIYGTTNYTYTGSNITVLLLPGVSYEFSFSSVSGYSEPATLELTTVWNGNTTIYVVYDKETQKDYLTLAIKDNGIVRFDPNTDGRDGKTYDYRINGTSWVKNLTYSTAITVSDGDIIQFRGDNLSYRNGDSNFMGFYGTTCSFDVYGNVMSLYDKNDFEEITTIPYGHSFNGLFYDCRGLISAADLELPATTLGQFCYRHMFANCVSLTTAPELPATTLASYCYSHMFQNCTSLAEAPELPATVLPIYAYYSMFNGCTLLNYIKCLATDISAENCTTDWVDDVSSTGTFVKDASMTDWTTGYNGIPVGWVVKNNGDLDVPLTFKIIEAGNVNWRASISSYTKTIEYKLNDGEWTTITSNTGDTSISVSEGDTIQFRGNNATYASGDVRYNTFSGSTAKFEVEGNIMSLIDSENFITATTLASIYTFCYLFRNCTGLTSAENLVLPVTALTRECYYCMFVGCTSLTTAPALPAETLATSCYGYMFQGCTSLTAAPALPATSMAGSCYYGMFQGCTGLTSAPALPATTLASNCYTQMFVGCTNLTSAPALPATTLANECYTSMFSGCTSLTSAPELPATTLAAECYSAMFRGCTNLNYIKCLATNISASNCTTNWVGGVSSTGTFVKDANMSSWTTGDSGIPTNWTVVDNS